MLETKKKNAAYIGNFKLDANSCSWKIKKFADWKIITRIRSILY